MKATHANKSGIKLTYVRVEMSIDTTMIEQIITDMQSYNKMGGGLDGKMQKINRTTVKDEICTVLRVSGKTWFDYSFWDNWKEIPAEAKELAQKLFPDFY